jgi:alkaline phosphatase D
MRGLAPDHGYWYRFRAGRAVSRVGRARTPPLPGTPVGRFRLGVVSCQHYEQGYFAAYRHMLADDLDLVLHLGDYIYENASWADEVRRHEGPEPVTLDQYRSRHALYQLDPDLQAAHAAYPWVLTWDDHEVDNDYAGAESQDRDDPAAFLRRRAAAYQAYYEHMPLRRLARPVGPALTLYQRLPVGDLLQLHVLDGRQYRDDQACGEGGSGGGRVVEACPARLDPRRTMLGAEQERWLFRGLERAAARWTALGQAQLMAPLTQRGPTGQPGYWTDGWDGYPAARDRLLARLARAPNPVVLGGDIHSFWVTDLKRDFADPGAAPIATEFVGTSVTSAGLPYPTFAGYARESPHVRFFESRRRGYLRCEVTAARWQTDLRVLDDVRDPGTDATTLATFVVEAGVPGAQRASGP